MKQERSGHAGRTIASLLGIASLVAVLQFAACPAVGLITESFESGTLGSWTKGYNYDPAFFDIAVSSLYAMDGIYSVKMQAHGLPSPPYPQMSVWIERSVRVPPSTTMDVGITFFLYNENASYSPENVLAYFGDSVPSDFPDFTIIGQTQSTVGWKYFAYQTTVTTPPNGWLFAAFGFHNFVTGIKYYFFDQVNLTGVSDDFTPPIITNLQPLNQTLISDDTPVIGASYSDPSGIDTSSVVLKMDAVDLTSMSTVTASDVSYAPVLPLAQGLHNVYLEVKDDSENHNRAVATWRFTVDSLPPVVTRIDPGNHSTVGVTTPLIDAYYTDSSGVNTSTVFLAVDSTDVTSSATITGTSLTYTPVTPLAQGLHKVDLSLSDNSLPPNVAMVSWQFTVDSLPPTITDLRPGHLSTVSTKTPVIMANYSDPSLVDMSSVSLRLDGVDVTSSSLVTLFYVKHIPLTPLAEGSHSVSLSVKDSSPAHNVGMANWQFAVDSLVPTIQILSPLNNSATSDSTPLISAAYADSSGIDTSSVVLTVDAVNVTASSTVTSGQVTYTPPTALAEGSHSVYVSVRDASPNHLLAATTWTFTTDSAPPTTTLSVLTPKFLNATSGRTYVSSLTMLRLTADDGAGVGVQSTEYLYYAQGKTPPGYSQYSYQFTIPNSEPDGLIYVKFRSTDSLSNIETEKTVELYLDNIAPVGNVPNFDETTLKYVNDALTLIAVEAADPGSGIQSINYGVDDSSCPRAYTAPFAIGAVAGDGEHWIHYTAVDNVGNAAPPKHIRLFLDTTAPTAEAGSNVRINPGATVRFDGTDSSDGTNGSGIVNYTWFFTYEDDTIVLYGARPTFRFDTRGTYEVTLRVEDMAGNEGSDVMTVSFLAGGGASSESSELPWWLVLIAIAVIAVVLLLLLFVMKRKKDAKGKKDESTPVLKCSSCGRALKADDEFCSKCGAPVKKEDGTAE